MIRFMSVIFECFKVGTVFRLPLCKRPSKRSSSSNPSSCLVFIRFSTKTIARKDRWDGERGPGADGLVESGMWLSDWLLLIVVYLIRNFKSFSVLFLLSTLKCSTLKLSPLLCCNKIWWTMASRICLFWTQLPPDRVLCKSRISDVV